MARLDFKIDPASGDFVKDAAGWFEDTESSDTSVYMQATHHFDAWWGDPLAGSRLHEARDRGDGDEGQQFVAVELERALGVLVDDGRIADVNIEIARPKAGRFFVEPSYRDLQTGRVVEAVVDPFKPPSGV